MFATTRSIGALIFVWLSVMLTATSTSKTLSDDKGNNNYNNNKVKSVKFSQSHQVATVKRSVTASSDIDLQTCIANFAVHPDKIIRTQDSQAMGAKYLNEIGLGSKEECLTLCCETENCDVFVFEERNSGSCYLFQCGPPEDFKCKFTHHVNYSSAILAIGRHSAPSADLESQIKLTKHEQDLSKLRKPVMGPYLGVVPTIQPSTTTVKQISQKEILPLAEINSYSVNDNQKIQQDKERTKSLSNEGRKCSRFQFECRSTSECIAIYNACDGIPQCADGSDEAPELGCPDTTTLPPPPPPPQPVPALPVPIIPVAQHNINNNNPQQGYSDNNNNNNNQNIPMMHPLPPVLPQSDLYHPRPPPSNNPTIPQQQHPDFIRPTNNRFVPPANSYEQQQYNSWGGNQPQINPQIPNTQYGQSGKNGHIFNHKENGLQVSPPDEGGQDQSLRYFYYKNKNKVNNVHKGAMQELHRALEVYHEGQQGQYGDQYNNPYNYDPYRQQPDNTNQNNWLGPNVAQQEPPPQYNNNNPYQNAVKTTHEITPKHEQDKMADELQHSKHAMAVDAPQQEEGEPKIIKIEKHVNHQYPDVVAYKVDDAEDLPDGVAQVPGGAILSLTFGLIITCLMALLIVCQLRVRRRMRKGGKSYAHDADYLVNGMYL